MSTLTQLFLICTKFILNSYKDINFQKDGLITVMIRLRHCQMLKVRLKSFFSLQLNLFAQKISYSFVVTEPLISKLKNFQSLWIYSIILMELLSLQRRKRQIHRIIIDCYYLLFVMNKYMQFVQKFIKLEELNSRKENSG